MTHERGIKTGAHFIFGLPGESLQEMLATAATISRLPLDSVKFHQLQIVKGTKMEHEFSETPADFHQFSLEGYVAFIVRFVEQLNPAIVIERFSGEVPPRFMTVGSVGVQNFVPLQPQSWGLIRYDAVLRLIEKEFERQDTWQGKYYT